MPRTTLEKIELSADYYVTVGPHPDPSYSDRIFTFSAFGETQRIVLHAGEIEVLIPVLQQARKDMLREECAKVDAADNSFWERGPEALAKPESQVTPTHLNSQQR